MSLEKFQTSLDALRENDILVRRSGSILSATLYLFGDVDDGMAKRVLYQLDLLLRSNVSDVSLEIHSGGGSVTDGMAIYDAVENLVSFGVKAYGRVRGECSSIAAVILQACSHRAAYENATIMHHRGTTSGASNVNPDEVLEAAAYDKRQMDKIDRLMYDRVVDKYAGGNASFEQFQRDGAKSVYMTAEEALHHGFIDTIIKS